MQDAQQLAENVVKSRAVRLMGHRALLHHWRAWSRLADQHRKVRARSAHYGTQLLKSQAADCTLLWELMNACEIRRCGKIQDTLMRMAARLRNRKLGRLDDGSAHGKKRQPWVVAPEQASIDG